MWVRALSPMHSARISGWRRWGPMEHMEQHMEHMAVARKINRIFVQQNIASTANKWGKLLGAHENRYSASLVLTSTRVWVWTTRRGTTRSPVPLGLRCVIVVAQSCPRINRYCLVCALNGALMAVDNERKSADVIMCKLIIDLMEYWRWLWEAIGTIWVRLCQVKCVLNAYLYFVFSDYGPN